MKRAALLIAVMLFLPVQAQDIYRWVDQNGVIHYSDQPHDGAEKVTIRPAQSYESTLKATPEGFDPAAVGTSEESLSYTMIRIVSPPEGEAIWATGGVFTVEVETVPALQPGHGITLTLNGNEMPGMPVATTRIGVTGLIRGEHTLQAAVVDASGQMQIFSPEIKFNVLQASVNQPQRQRSAP